MSSRRYHQIIRDAFALQAVVNGSALREKGRVFSLQIDSAREFCIIIKPDLRPSWPDDKRRCDGILIAYRNGLDNLVIVFIELKGGHIEKALRQIESSCEVMCKKSLMAPNKHDRWHDLKIDGDIVRLPGHGKIVTGLILGKRGIALAQQQKLSIRKKLGIHLTFLQGNYTGKTLSELERIFHPAGA